MSMFVKALFLISVLSVFPFSIQALAASDKLVFYTVDYPPYAIKDPDNEKLRGSDIEVIIEAFKKVGVDADVRFMPWKRIVDLGKTGKVAGAVSCVYLKKREDYFLFSKPISQSTQTFTYTERYVGPELKELKDAKGLKIIVVSGYSVETELKEAHLHYDTAMSDHAAIKRLLERPYDVFYTTREFMEYEARRGGFSSRVRYYDLQKIDYHLCISRKWPNSAEITRTFNKGLEMLQKDGTFKKIHDKYR